jgi:hypothetical protein
MNALEAYISIRGYFSRPEAILARDEGDNCVYRTSEGDKCAVGCLIPEDLYFAFEHEDSEPDIDGHYNALEGNSVETLLGFLSEDGRIEAQKLHALLDDNPRKVEFLSAAQKLHDTVANDAADFVRLLDGLAVTSGLAYGQGDGQVVPHRNLS